MARRSLNRQGSGFDNGVTALAAINAAQRWRYLVIPANKNPWVLALSRRQLSVAAERAATDGIVTALHDGGRAHELALAIISRFPEVDMYEDGDAQFKLAVDTVLDASDLELPRQAQMINIALRCAYMALRRACMLVERVRPASASFSQIQGAASSPHTKEGRITPGTVFGNRSKP
jgi:hypothetical protein